MKSGYQYLVLVKKLTEINIHLLGIYGYVSVCKVCHYRVHLLNTKVYLEVEFAAQTAQKLPGIKRALGDKIKLGRIGMNWASFSYVPKDSNMHTYIYMHIQIYINLRLWHLNTKLLLAFIVMYEQLEHFPASPFLANFPLIPSSLSFYF